MFGGLQKNSAFYHFRVPIYGENMHFCQNMVEKIISKFLKLTISDVFLPRTSISGAKNSLKCEKLLANFTLSSK